MPVGGVPAPNKIYGEPALQGTNLTFIAAADARVQEANRSTNYGTSASLQVNGLNNPDIESFIRFTVSGVTGPIQGALLRVYITTNSSTNSPAVYGASNSWTETGITWRTRPARTTSALDNKGATSTNTWVEYNVGALVNGNGTYTLVLVADSSDGITISSREGSRPPELVITLNPPRQHSDVHPTATQSTATSTSSLTSTPTAQTPTSTAPPTDTNTPTMTPSPTASQTVNAYSQPTKTSATGSTLTFTTAADARVAQLIQRRITVRRLPFRQMEMQVKCRSVMSALL